MYLEMYAQLNLTITVTITITITVTITKVSFDLLYLYYKSQYIRDTKVTDRGMFLGIDLATMHTSWQIQPRLIYVLNSIHNVTHKTSF